MYEEPKVDFWGKKLKTFRDKTCRRRKKTGENGILDGLKHVFWDMIFKKFLLFIRVQVYGGGGREVEPGPRPPPLKSGSRHGQVSNTISATVLAYVDQNI